MKRWENVAIVGVGLIGGSIGLGLLKRGLAAEVTGIGRREESLKTAREVGAITSSTTDLAAGVSRANLIIVCTPVKLIAPQVLEISRHCPDGALITDVGSTKQEIVQALKKKLPRGVRFIGSHPIAGSEKCGPLAAESELFVGRTTVVTPVAKSSKKDLQEIREFWSALGSQVSITSPQKHDRILASTSHLPHLAAAALAAVTPEKFLPFTAGGWTDTTRIAAGEVELWSQILLSNRESLLKALDRYAELLAEYRTSLKRGDVKKISKLLAQGKRIRDAVGN